MWRTAIDGRGGGGGATAEGAAEGARPTSCRAGGQIPLGGAHDVPHCPTTLDRVPHPSRCRHPAVSTRQKERGKASSTP